MYRVHAVDPVNKSILTSWILPPAGTPKALLAAVSAFATGTSTPQQHALLRSEYGTDYKSMLRTPDPFTSITGGMEIGVSHTGLKGANVDDLVIDDEDLLLETSDTPMPTRQEKTKVTVEESKSSLDVVYPGGTIINTSVHIYPEDRLSSLRRKIYLITGIPPYRQHIFYCDPNGTRLTTYRVYSESSVHVDIVGDLSGESSKDILGMRVDRVMYESRDSLRVDTIETFNLIETMGTNDWYVVDLDLFTHSVKSQLAQLSHERYQFELLYYGFVLKYFPLLTFEVFHEYVRNEKELFQKYPDLAPSTSYLKSLYSAEAQIADRIVRTPHPIKSTINLGVGVAVLGPTHIPGIINIRNLFDLLKVSIGVPEIRAYIDNPPSKYLVTKTWSSTSPVPFPSSHKTGLMICVSLMQSDQNTFHRAASSEKFDRVSTRYAYISVKSNGKVTIRLSFNEESSGDFEYVEKVAMGILNPYINMINSMGRQVFGTSRDLTILSHHNVSYETITLSVYWKKIFSTGMFKVLRGLFEKYVHAGIVTMKPTQTVDTIDMVWRRGIYQFDPSQIERILVMASTNTDVLNHYMWLTNTTIHTKWLQIYDGRGFKVHHRATDIRFECINMRRSEFQWLFKYLELFISDASKDPALCRGIPASDATTKKLRKLREADPELYNLKKHGSDRVYSIICQLPNQPLLYTPEEFEGLSATDKKRLIKYWNFTYNRPAYYSCPHNKYPYFAFKTGFHPKGYCLPCCKKTPPDDTPVKALVHKACLDRKPISDDQIEALSSDISRHTISYGKTLTPGRVSRTPPSLSPLLANTLDPTLKYYLVGVEQGDDGLTRLFHCMTLILNIAPKTLASELSDYAKSGVYFDVGLNGNLRSHFRDRSQLSSVIKKLPTLTILDTSFRQWDNLIMEIVSDKYKLHTVIMDDPDGAGTRSIMRIPDYTRTSAIDGTLDRICIVCTSDTTMYPMVVLDNNYYKTFATNTTIYTGTSPLLSYIIGAIRAIPPPPRGGIDLSDIRKITTDHQYTITVKYINLKNKCYGVLIREMSSGGHPHYVYVPLVPSPHYPDGIHCEYTGYNGKLRIKLSSTLSMLSVLRTAFPQYASVYTPSQVLSVDSKSTPFAITCGPGKDIWYVTDWDTPHTLTPIYTGFDPRVVDELIVSGAQPSEDPRTTLQPQALYQTYLYQLLVIEFSAWVSRLRDTGTRSRIIGDLGKHSGKQLRSYHKDLISRVNNVNISQQDHSDILGLVLSLPIVSVGEFLEVFAHTQYEFDRVPVTSLTPNDHQKLIEILRSITTITDSMPTMGNVFVACDSNKSGAHCINGKLAISEPDLLRFSSVLNSDLHNKFLRKTILSGINVVGTVDFLRFEPRANTIIRIHRIP